MLSPQDRVGVAVSGGADSVVLLHVLHRFAAYQIVILHVNHQLRGAESDADEAFVRALALKLGLLVQVKQAPPGEGNMEQEARNLRRAFFAECREKLHLRAVALGHNQTDQAETVLYRFLRGSGLAGLAGMSPVNTGLIRPMLDLTREEIRDWAKLQNLVWREDSTNENKELVRNKLRLEVINPQLVRVLSAAANVSRDEEEFWAAKIGPLFSELACTNDVGIQLSVSELRELHPAEQRRLLRHAIRALKTDLRSIDVAHIEAIRKLLESESGHDRVLLPGVDALRSFGTLLLAVPGQLSAEPRGYRENIKFESELALPRNGGRLCVRRMNRERLLCGTFGDIRQIFEEISDLDGDLLKQFGTPDSMYVRSWQPGDEYRRAGHAKPAKLKTLFQEYRVLLWDRRRWPVLAIEDEIIWSRRFGAAAQVQATDASRSIVRVLYSPCAGLTPAESKGGGVRLTK